MGGVGAGNIGNAPVFDMPRAADAMGAPPAAGGGGATRGAAGLGAFGGNHAGGAAAPAPGFAGLVGAGGGDAGGRVSEGSGKRPAEMVLQAVVVVSAGCRVSSCNFLPLPGKYLCETCGFWYLRLMCGYVRLLMQLERLLRG